MKSSGSISSFKFCQFSSKPFRVHSKDVYPTKRNERGEESIYHVCEGKERIQRTREETVRQRECVGHRSEFIFVKIGICLSSECLRADSNHYRTSGKTGDKRVYCSLFLSRLLRPVIRSSRFIFSHPCGRRPHVETLHCTFSLPSQTVCLSFFFQFFRETSLPEDPPFEQGFCTSAKSQMHTLLCTYCLIRKINVNHSIDHMNS